MSDSKSTDRNERVGPIVAAFLAAAALAAALVCGQGAPPAHAPLAAVVPGAVVGAPGASPWADLGALQKRPLPGGYELSFPERGMEGRFLLFIQDGTAVLARETWFDFDRLLFDTNQATLRPESSEQLENIVIILRAYPNVAVKVGGYTDSSGPTEQNVKLSQARADSVKAELAKRGIAPERLAAEGYGEKFPVGDNATEEGRARNRRTAIRVTAK